MGSVSWRCAACGVAVLILASCGREDPPAPEPAAVFDPAPAPAPPPVTMRGSQALSIDSALLGHAYELRVQLPPGYADPENADRLYPVLYLNDGPMNFLIAAGVTTLPMSEGLIEDLILVGIGYAQDGGGSQSRIRDYTPTDNPAWDQPTGGAGDYLAFVEQELIPFVETRYRADPERRALSGHSLGGLFGAYVLLTKPDLFQHYILSSPSFWFHQNVTWSLEEAYAAAHDDLPARVYVSIGALERPGIPGGSDYDMVGDVRTFERLLNDRNYPGLDLRAAVVEGHNHETVLPTALMNGILWHFSARPDVPFGY